MKHSNYRPLLWCLLMLFVISCSQEPAEKQDPLAGLRAEIEAMDRQYSEHFKNKDSVALADMYSSDGSLQSITGRENLISTFGNMIREAGENNTPNMLFSTTGLTRDEEFVAELGIYRFADDEGTVQREGKYLVVWKIENGQWKIYKDVPL